MGCLEREKSCWGRGNRPWEQRWTECPLHPPPEAMQALWGEGPHHAEMEDLLRERAAARSAKRLGVLELMKAPALRKPLAVTVLLILSLQLSGLIAVE